jgi:nitrogen fixation protein NifX
MKVAFATTDGVLVDEHFGRAGRFVVYEFTAAAATPTADRIFADGQDARVEGTRGMGEAHDQAVHAKVDRLADCRIIYVTSVGGPSAARLVQRGVMPVKVPERTAIAELVHRLRDTIRTAPPPWLRRALSDQPAANQPEGGTTP